MTTSATCAPSTKGITAVSATRPSAAVKPNPGPTDYFALTLMALLAMIGFVLIYLWVSL